MGCGAFDGYMSYACQRVERASGLIFVLRLCHSILPERRAVFSGDHYSLRRRYWWIHGSGTGEARYTVLFCGSVIELSWSRWVRGSGFRWISTLGHCALGMCMPACREGERTELCFCACAAQFSRIRAGVFGGSLPLAAALSVATCQREGRGGAMLRFRLHFRH